MAALGWQPARAPIAVPLRRVRSLRGLDAAAALALVLLFAAGAAGVTVVAAVALLVVGTWVLLRAPEALLAVAVSQGTLKSLWPFVTLPGDLLLLSTAAVVVACVLAVRRHGLPRLQGGVAGSSALMLVLVALMLVGGIRSLVPGATYKAVYFEVFSATLFAAAIILLRDPAGLARLAAGTVVAGFVVALSARAGTGPNEPLTVAGGNEIVAALYPAAGALAAITALAMSSRGVRRVLWLAAAAYLTIMAIRAGSRGVLLSLVAAGLATTALLIAHAHNRARATLVAASVGLVIAVGFGAVAGPVALARYTRLSNDPRRAYMRDRAVEFAVDNPLGTGIGGFAVNLPEMGPTSGVPVPHNVVLELLTDGGAITAGVFLALLAVAARGAARGRREPGGVFVVATLVFSFVGALGSDDVNGARGLWVFAGAAVALEAMARARAAPSATRPGLSPGAAP
jgi:O-antigen ligase